MSLVVVAYDISNDRRRVRMHTLLSGYGENVQESVFECELDDTRRTRLIRRIMKLVRPEDKVRIYTLCSACADRTENGRGGQVPSQPPVYLA